MVVQTIGQLVGTSSKSAHLERLYIEGVGKTPFYLSVKYCALVSLYGASHSVEDLVSYVSLPSDHPASQGSRPVLFAVLWHEEKWYLRGGGAAG